MKVTEQSTDNYKVLQNYGKSISNFIQFIPLFLKGENSDFICEFKVRQSFSEIKNNRVIYFNFTEFKQHKSLKYGLLIKQENILEKVTNSEQMLGRNFSSEL